MLATLFEARNSTLRNIAGACANSQQFRDWLNEATQRLMRRGDWSGLIVPIHVCIRKGCVVWPRYVGQVRKINFCKTPIPIRNLWYDFLEYRNPGGNCWFSGQCWSGWCGAEARMIQQARSPVYSDIFGDNRLVRAYPTVNADYGKTLTIFGLDNNNQPLRHQNPDGTWNDGAIITLANPFGSTNIFVRSIDRVLLDDMQGRVFLYAYDAVNDVLEDLAFYDPGETNPEYERFQLHLSSCQTSPGSTTTGTCDTAKGAVALIKLKFVPARFDTDLVLIKNLQALKDMISSIKFKEAGDIELSRAYEQDAIRELNLELRDDEPEDQMPVDLGEFNGVPLGVQKMF